MLFGLQRPWNWRQPALRKVIISEESNLYHQPCGNLVSLNQRIAYILRVLTEYRMAFTLALLQDTLKESQVVCALKAYWRSRGIAPLIVNLGTGCRCVENLTLWPLYRREGTRPGSWIGRSERFGEKFLGLSGIRNPDHPACSIITIRNTLSRLLL